MPPAELVVSPLLIPVAPSSTPSVGKCRGHPASFTDEERGPGTLSDLCRAAQAGSVGAGTQLTPRFQL